jgi:outer membrane scaffolding protein for murein synthesis (MipA/OmpV family)
LVVAGTAAAGTAVNAQAKDKSDAGPWEFSVGAVVVSAPEYEGAKKRVTGVVPDLNVSYKSKDFGTFGVGSKSRGLSWTPIDTDEYSFGFTVSSSAGRVDTKDGSIFRPGSKSLRGLGEIKTAAEYGVFGHVVLGMPIRAQIMKGSGDGKPDAKDFSVKGHGGTHASIAAELPIPVSDSVTFSISPNLTWADAKYTQTYFGISSAQAARSGRKAFKADGGLKSVGLDMGVNYAFDKHWSANAGVSVSQLRSDAALSPLVQKKNQTSAIAGVSYQF